MSMYTSDEDTPETFSDCHQEVQVKKEHKKGSKKGKKCPKEKRTGETDFISCLAKPQENFDNDSGAENYLAPEEARDIPWIREGFDELKSMETHGSYALGQGDDHFRQVLNSQAPSSRETSELLDQVLKLRDELEGRIKDLTGFKEEIRELGKLLKAEPSRQSQQ